MRSRMGRQGKPDTDGMFSVDVAEQWNCAKSKRILYGHRAKQTAAQDRWLGGGVGRVDGPQSCRFRIRFAEEHGCAT